MYELSVIFSFLPLTPVSLQIKTLLQFLKWYLSDTVKNLRFVFLPNTFGVPAHFYIEGKTMRNLSSKCDALRVMARFPVSEGTACVLKSP